MQVKKNTSIASIRRSLHNSIDSSPQKVAYFFKTGIGEYAEFDKFLGITMPTLRKIAKEFMNLSFDNIQILLCSEFNEERALALIILVAQYQKQNLTTQKNIYTFYLHNLQNINNWNLVDISAHHIVGAYLWHKKERRMLIALAKSNNLWQRRVAIIATFYFIKQKHFTDTIKIVSILIHDSHDLIHKACGWMLREIGKQELSVLINFLNQYHKLMPRTMLRYAIEKLPQKQRRKYLYKK